MNIFSSPCTVSHSENSPWELLVNTRESIVSSYLTTQNSGLLHFRFFTGMQNTVVFILASSYFASCFFFFLGLVFIKSGRIESVKWVIRPVLKVTCRRKFEIQFSLHNLLDSQHTGQFRQHLFAPSFLQFPPM